MGRTTALRAELKRRLYPALLQQGFLPDLRSAPTTITFRRTTATAVHVCDVQFEKYGSPRLVVNFGRCGPKGMICHGEHVAAADVCPGQTLRSGRLTPRPGGSTAAWFRQDRGLLARLIGRPDRPAREVVSELLALLPEVEAFFADGAVGPHLRVWDAGPGVAEAA